MQSERERKEIAGIKKLANERAKKANLHNKKLRDCRTHLTDMRNPQRLDSTMFITEGDSASGSITIARDVNTQAVFSLKGKPLNCFGLTKKIVYENEEFNLLQNALSIEDGLEGLRFNRVVIATDADVDGMHIRLLILTFFLQFFPELVKGNHVYILQTPLFRVRNKKETIYCYSDKERQIAIGKLGAKPEITRFKGLGELRHKESDRLEGIKSLLTSFGAEARVEGDDLVVNGVKGLKSATVDSLGDHRLAMTGYIAGFLAPGTSVVLGASCAEISYPTFYEDFAARRK